MYKICNIYIKVVICMYIITFYSLSLIIVNILGSQKCTLLINVSIRTCVAQECPDDDFVSRN
jgi:hypothetical protein